MPDKTITYIKKRWHTLRSSLLRYMKKPEEEVKWLSRVSFVCFLVCTITWSKLPQYDPSFALAVQNEPGACSGSTTPRGYGPL